MTQPSLQRVDGATTLRRRKLCFIQTLTAVSAIILFSILLPNQNFPTKFIQVITPYKSPFDLYNTPKVTNTSNKSNKLSTCFSSQRCSSGNVSSLCCQRTLKDTFQCRHLMVLQGVDLGRTGNQIFEVAALLGVASYHGYTAVIDSSISITKLFDLPNLFTNTQLILNKNTAKTLTETAPCIYNERVRNISHNSNWTLHLQSWKYFEGAEDIVRNGLRLKDQFTSKVRRFIDSKVSVNTQAVSIHVRRGDFVNLYNRGFTVAPVEYITKAMEYFRNKYDRVHFFAVSDDKNWFEQNLRWANVTISPFKTVGLDMALMAESDHVIVTSGSFGWWGAWLSGGETVYWMGFPGKGTWLGNNTVIDDFYPRTWIGLW